MKKTDNKSRRKMNRRHTHTSIPAILLYDRTLTLPEAFVLAEINALDGEDGCYAMNIHFATLLRISEDRAGKIISGLVKKGRLTREIMASKKGKKRFLSVVWKVESHTVKTPDGHPVDVPDGSRYKQPVAPGKNTGCYKEEVSGEATGRGQSTSPPPEKETLETKATKALAKARYFAGPSVTDEFVEWFETNVLGLFDKFVVTAIMLTTWYTALYEKFGEEASTKAVVAHRANVAGWSPNLAKVVKLAKPHATPTKSRPLSDLSDDEIKDEIGRSTNANYTKALELIAKRRGLEA